MKLTSATQPGLRRRRPDHRRESMAFWLGIAILMAFELVLMAKSWSPASAGLIFGYDADRDRSELGSIQGDAAGQSDATDPQQVKS